MPTKTREPFSRITVQEAQEMMGRDDVVVIDVRDRTSTSGTCAGCKVDPG
jgi:rhodanese-related sulfurtransferase